MDSDLEGAVSALKQEDGGPILLVGSRSVAHALLRARLVDEINPQVFPLILRSGMRIYPETGELTKLELASSRALEGGVVLQTYRVLG